MPDVTFFFDPGCPWTWRASRWLCSVAAARDLDVAWRPCSLQVLNGNDAPERYRAPMEASARALRLVEALAAADRHGEIDRFYTQIGTRTFEADETISDDAVRSAAEAAGLGGDLAALDDTRLDEAVRRSTDEAMALAGPEVGSPVVHVTGAERGLHGPILGSVPEEKEALVLWDAFESLARMDVFFELKRGRSQP